MRLRCAALLLTLGTTFACQASPANKSKTVLLVAHRSGSVEFVDPASFATISSIRIGSMTEWVSARPDGSTLIIARPTPAEPQGCCALYSLDLETGKMTFLIYPAQRGAFSSDGHVLFAQRGNVGIDTIDLLTLRRGPVVGPCGKTYLLPSSPYRRWLFGVANWPSPSLDIFDLKTNALARRLEVPGHPLLTGAWSGDAFHLLGYAKGHGTLWSVTPETQKLPQGTSVDLHALGHDCRSSRGGPSVPLLLGSPVTAAGRLFVYEAFGMKLDRRNCAAVPAGGVYVLDPSSGAVVAHLAASLYFMQIVASCDGSELYGIALGPTLGKGPELLVRLDARTGKILASREIGSEEKGWDVVHVSLATLWDSLIPRDELRAVEAPPPSWPACPLTKPTLDEPPRDPNASPFGFGEWYINDSRTIWVPRFDWRAGRAEKVIWIRPAGMQLEITGRRLDGPAPPLRADVPGVGAYPSGFLVMGLSFPAEGCWEVTAKAGSDELRFVTAVGPPVRTTMAHARAAATRAQRNGSPFGLRHRILWAPGL